MISKSAQLKAIWPLIYQKLKNPPPGVNLGKFPATLPSMDKIIIDSSGAQNANALGYVTTEDSDSNGKIDKLHIVMPNLEKLLKGVTPKDLDGSDPQKLYQILAPFVEIIAHEMGHLKDHKPGQENQFPGGEGVADQSAKEILNQISVQATNINNKVIIRSSNMKKQQIIQRLVKLAESLDQKKAYKLSDEVISLAEKYAQEIDPGEAKPFGTGNLGRKPMPDGSAVLKQKANHEASHGRIRIKGDPFSYEIHPQGGYYIAKAPEQYWRSYLARIQPGDEGYPLVHDAAVNGRITGPVAPPHIFSQHPTAGPAPKGVADFELDPNSVAPNDLDLSNQTSPGPVETGGYKQRQQTSQADDYDLPKVDAKRKKIASFFGMWNIPEVIEQFLLKELKDYAEKNGKTEVSLEKALECAPVDDKSAHYGGISEWAKCVYDKCESDVAGGDSDDVDVLKEAATNANFWGIYSKTPFGR